MSIRDSVDTPDAVARRRPIPGYSWLRRVLMVFGLPTVLIVVWWITSERADSIYFPPLSEIFGLFGKTWFESDRITHDVVPSIVRLLIAYGLALLIGIALGVAIGLSRSLRSITEPVLEFFRAVPPPVLIPVLMLFLGIGAPMKIWVIVFGTVWPILLNTIEGVRAFDDVLRDTVRSYRLGPRRRLAVTLRGASPQIVTGARQGLAIAVILMVLSEMFAANEGLGYTVVFFQRSFAIPEMWSGIIVLGLLGVTLSLIFRLMERRLLFWYHGQRQSQRGGN
ncbi:ABC transporter permease [Microbacterium sp. dk485]|uniref:ABC transporter permease n=1 Tax=Microbacterium sp. dk485 TaxID=2560021 RepID=UPI001FD74EEC|nr:ABC transporter permease [Microbacterium sp. dk485]